jgi:hypothetical protein
MVTDPGLGRGVVDHGAGSSLGLIDPETVGEQAALPFPLDPPSGP